MVVRRAKGHYSLPRLTPLTGCHSFGVFSQQMVALLRPGCGHIANSASYLPTSKCLSITSARCPIISGILRNQLALSGWLLLNVWKHVQTKAF